MTTYAGIRTAPRRPWPLRQARRVVRAVDQRIAHGGWPNRPRSAGFRQWSVWLGYIAVFSFVMVVVSGVVLAFWYQPSMDGVTYDGAYAPLRGVEVSQAFASTMDISIEVPGGLLVRQIHSWATHIFLAAMAAHLAHVFFTGGFRGRSGRRTWLIGLALMVVGIVAAYTGHGLPHDLLAGTGLRVVEGGTLSIPVVGTALAWLIFGGQYPGNDIVTRFSVIHLVATAIIVALLVLAVRPRRPARGAAPAVGRAVGSATTAIAARAGGLMVIVFGFIAMMAATIQINPIWLHGPFDPSTTSTGSRPPWYLGFLDGAQRLMPPWKIDISGHEWALAVFIPVIVVPGVMLVALAVYPWIEQKIIGADTAERILDRPRWMPGRTGIGVAFLSFYLLLWIAGGNDALADVFHVPVEWVTRSLQVAVVVVPPLVYSITTRICIGLQRRDLDAVVHGAAAGVIAVDPDGGFSGVHRQLNADGMQAATPRQRPGSLDPGPAVDDHGVPAPGHRWSRLRARLSRVYYGDVIDHATPADISTGADDAATHPDHGRRPGVGEESRR